MTSPNSYATGTETQLQLPLWVGGRAYPTDLREQLPKDREQPIPQDRLPKDREPSPEISDQVVGQIETVLRGHLVFAEKQGTYQDFQELLRDFSTSINFVRDCRTQFRESIEALWRLNTEFHCKDRLNKPARDAFLNRHYEMLANIIRPTFEALDITVGAQIEDMVLGIAEAALRERIYHAVHRLAVQICDILDEFTRHAIVGVWQQVTPTACNALFFRYVIVQENMGRETIVSEPQILAVHDRLMSVVREIGQIETKITQGKHTRQIAAYQLYLSQTKSYPAAEFPHSIPQNIKRYLEQLPDWFRDCIQIVGGDRKSMRITVEDVLEKKHWEDVQVKSKVLHEETVHKGCPLVVIGHYVLAGWGEEEDQLEDARQWSTTLRILAVLLLVLSCGLIVLGGWLVYGSAVAAGLGLVAFVEGNRLKRTSEKQTVRWGNIVYQGTAWFVLTVGLMMLAQGIVIASLFLKLTGIGCLVLLAISHVLRQTVFPPK